MRRDGAGVGETARTAETIAGSVIAAMTGAMTGATTGGMTEMIAGAITAAGEMDTTRKRRRDIVTASTEAWKIFAIADEPIRTTRATTEKETRFTGRDSAGAMPKAIASMAVIGDGNRSG